MNDFNLYGRNFRVMSQADSSFRGSLKGVEKFYVRNSQGSMIPLGSLISSKVIEAPAVISHYNIYRSVEINGSPKPGVEVAVKQLKRWKKLPKHYLQDMDMNFPV